jgi:hypothetical protein
LDAAPAPSTPTPVIALEQVRIKKNKINNTFLNVK